MRAWLDDRYDFEWVWASKEGSGSTDAISFDVTEEQSRGRSGQSR